MLSNPKNTVFLLVSVIGVSLFVTGAVAVQKLLPSVALGTQVATVVSAVTPPAGMESIAVLDAGAAETATLFVPRNGIQPSEIAVLINDNDPQSVEVANYYRQKRNIPAQNMIHLSFDQNKIYPGFTVNNGIAPADFALLKAQVDAAVGPTIQAFVISWSKPFRLAPFNYYSSNYSITSAFAFGVDPNYISVNSCNPMAVSPYYNTASTKPYTDYGVRPTMMLAGTSAANVEATIDKGLLADGSFPTGTGWLVRTADLTRSGPRYTDFQQTALSWNRTGGLTMNYYDYTTNGGYGDVRNTPGILFYETGAASVPNITTNTYVPGAVADHLTSNGGNLFLSDQMSILRWLEAGATGSYGTETEPCAYMDKFPQASVLVKNYFRGNTLIEAYTKSVKTPTQGVFVGDPLARPFGTKATRVGGTLTITTTSLEPGSLYTLYSAPSASGPFTALTTVTVPNYQFTTITVPSTNAAFYKLERGSAPVSATPTITISAGMGDGATRNTTVGTPITITTTVTPGSGDSITQSSLIDYLFNALPGIDTNVPPTSKSYVFTPAAPGNYIFYPSVTTTNYPAWNNYGKLVVIAVTSATDLCTNIGGTQSIVPTNATRTGSTCACNTGYTLQGGACVSNATCPNGLAIGTYPSCTCPVGQRQSGAVCVVPPPTTCSNGLDSSYAPGCSCPSSQMISGSACVPRPVIQSITLSTTRVQPGNSTTVSWSTSNMASCTLTAFSNTGTVTVSTALTGSATQTVNSATLLTLTCTDAAGGSYSKSVTANVAARFTEY